MDVRKEVEYKKGEERLSKNPHCCKYKNQRNSRFGSY